MSKERIINIHLISDSTGETLSSVSRAVLSQFENVDSRDFIWPLIRSKSQIDKVMKSIEENPGIVMYTILQDEIIDSLKKHCKMLQIPCVGILSHVIPVFSNYLGMTISNTVGRQHLLDEEYYARVEAIDFTMNHDDGQSNWNLHDAEVVLIGVSRTSKSPTCVYLSCRGYKAANIPFVSAKSMPDTVFELKKPLIVGLTINPEKLVQIRQSRLLSLGQEIETDYIDIESVKKEVAESRKLFAKLGCPIIDVTKRSVEETSARIIQLLQEKQQQEKKVL